MNVKQWIILLVALTQDVSGQEIAINQSSVFAQASFGKYLEKFKYGMNPESGYEPYWADGDGVLFDPTAETYSTKPRPYTEYVPTVRTTTTEEPPLVCGEVCHENYRTIKEVCTHHTNSNNMRGCWWHGHVFESQRQHCWNVVPDTFVDPFHEFPTYCEYLDATCRDDFTKARYILLHIGKCETEHHWFKDLGWYSNVVSRLHAYPLVDLATVPYYLDEKKTTDMFANIKTVAPPGAPPNIPSY